MRAVLAYVALLLAGCASQPELVGTWEAVHRSAGGIGSVWTFFPDGKIEMYSGPIVETWYATKGNQLLGPPESSSAGETSIVTHFRVEGGSLITELARGEVRLELHYSRVGHAKADSPPIVGVWRPEPPASADSIMEAHRKAGRQMDRSSAQRIADMHNQTRLEYTSDGISKFRLPLRTTRGTYDAANRTFVITQENGSVSRTGHLRLQDGLLVLTQPGGSTEDTYIRVEATKAELKRAGVRYGTRAAQLDPPADLSD